MLKRHVRLPPEHLYPADDWQIVETRPPGSYYDRAETVLSLGNGYLGVRGSYDEAREPVLSPGTFINGLHETWPITHPETAYGLAETGQTIIKAPDATVIRLYVDDEPLHLTFSRLRSYQRVLDMRAGTLTRELVWVTPAGRAVRVRSVRLVSLRHRHLLAISYEIEMLDQSVPIAVTSLVLNRQDIGFENPPGRPGRVDPRRAPTLQHRVLNAQIVQADETRFMYGYQAANSGMTLAVGVEHVIEAPAGAHLKTTAGDDVGELSVTAEPSPGQPIRILKYAAYHTSRGAPTGELAERAGRTLTRARRDGFDSLLADQRAELETFWSHADVQVDTGSGSAHTQQAVRWNLFQVAQATWRAEGVGVPAKGLTAQAYEGHYFWDQEIYILPVLAYTEPRIARNLLRFRHSLLGDARARALALDQHGALFPWRTINGREASAAYQAGTAQYHINAAVAHAVFRYMNAHDDLDLLVEAGAEILVETARLWADLGFYADDGSFHIHGVTGPDEYTTVVNDNAYTNLMARMNLNYAAEALARLAAERPDAHAALVSDLDVDPREPEAWTAAAAAMYVPYDERRGIHMQDAQFLDRETWDLANTPAERFPLLLHYHPLVIYRHQVIKQADIVLAMFLLGHEFSETQKRANFDYYDRLTTGDSSLSACIQSIVAAEIGDEPRALEYFRFALLMDLGDVTGDTADGVHIASAAGVWQALVFGFGGVRDHHGRLTIDPRLPAAWRSLAFSLRFGERRVHVELGHEQESYTLDGDAPLSVEIRGVSHELQPGAPLMLAAEHVLPEGAG